MVYDVIVLGAGINGLSTAYNLLRRKVGRLALLEQFTAGHSLGSSHGVSRITRSTYNSAKYVQLMQLAHSEEWPRLAAHAGKSFLHPTEGCFFGPGNDSYLQSVRAVPELAPFIEILEPARARKVFPHFSFPDSGLVIRDSTCAVVAASQVMSWLLDYVASRAALVDECPVERMEILPAEIRLHTPDGTYSCGRLVVTAGSWLGQLLPEFAPKLQVAHQDVGYFEIQGGADFPVWVYCPEQGDSFYGLPEFGRAGVKVARHRTGPEGDDPDRPISELMPQAVRAELEQFVARQFAGPAKCVGYEACLYTNTRSEDFLLDHYPGDSRIVVGSACSGHGFKFGPLTGRILAELLLDGKTSLQMFEQHRQAFSLAAHGDWPHA